MRFAFLVLTFATLPACAPKAEEPIFDGATDSCTLTRGTAFFGGVVDDSVADGATFRVLPGTSGGRFVVELYDEAATPERSLTLSTDSQGLLPIPLSDIPVGVTGIAVRKRVDGTVFGEGSIRRVSTDVPSILCGGIATEAGDTQPIPTDGVLRVHTREADGLQVTLYAGTVEWQGLRRVNRQIFFGTATVSNNIAEFPTGDTSGFPQAQIGYATLMDGEAEIDRLNELFFAPRE